MTHAHSATDDKKQNVKATQMPGTVEQMLEMRNGAHDGKVPEVLRTRLLSLSIEGFLVFSPIPYVHAQYVPSFEHIFWGQQEEVDAILSCLLSSFFLPLFRGMV